MLKIAGGGLVAFLFLSFTSFTAIADETGWASIHELRKERGKLCMSDHWHYGESTGTYKSKRRARRSAISSWQDFVDFEYGSSWGTFRRAANKKVDCSHSSSKWKCEVLARPCAKRRRQARRR